jgi:hypothetical protein
MPTAPVLLGLLAGVGGAMTADTFTARLDAAALILPALAGAGSRARLAVSGRVGRCADEG